MGTMKVQVSPGETLHPEAARSLENRGLDLEVVTRLGVVSSKTSCPTGDQHWVSFPHINGNGKPRHWAFRTVTGRKDFRLTNGEKPIVWNQPAIEDKTLASYPLVITEGHIDALSMMTAGIPRVVSVPHGAPAKETPVTEGQSKYDYLLKCGLEGVQEIILATDNDNPGHALLQDLANRLGKKRCRWVTYPEGCKDANDVLVKYGAEYLRNIVNDAKWMKVSGLYRLSELPPEPVEEIHSIGIAGVDELWKISRGRMSVVTGIPGHGKSQFVSDAICHLANQGFVIAIASFEDTPRGSLLERLLRWKMRKDPNYASEIEIRHATDWVEDHFIFIYPDEEDKETPTVNWYLERVEAAVLRFNVAIAVADPWNELDHHTVRDMEIAQTEYVGGMLAKMRRHAKRFRYHTVIVCHPKKMDPGKNGKYQAPTGYSCADSAHFYNKPDVGITVYREDDETNGEYSSVGCWKAKLEGKIGKKGAKMTFRFDLRSGRYAAAPEIMNSNAA